MVYLEAQTQELPVIAFKSMGVPLVVEHGETGFLAPEEDYAAMRANIVKLLGSSELREQMGQAARKKVFDAHSLEAAAKRLDECIRDL